MYIKCYTCGKKTYKRPRDIKAKRGKYCSRECYFQATKAKLRKCICENCQKEFYKKEWQLKTKSYSGRFCSHPCYVTYRNNHIDEFPTYTKGKLKCPELNKEKLIEEYLQNKLRMIDICKKYDLGYGTVNSRIKRFGIKTRRNKDYCDGNSMSAWQRFLNKKYKHTCQFCGWNKTTCDVHHKISPLNGGKNTKENLVVVCPNCHRLIHKNLLKI